MKTSFAVLLVLLCQGLFGLNVELQVKECAGVGTTGGYPISSVVPLPYGEYQDISKFRVTNDGGANVPAQFTVLNRNWMEDRSIANLLVNFQPTVSAYNGAGTGISKYYLKDDGAGNATGTGLQLTENSNTITVVTGPLKFTVSKAAFNIINELWLDKNGNGTYESSEQIINSNAQNGGVFAGRLPGDVQYDALRNDVTVTVEESGPMRIIIKAQAQTIYNSTVDHKHGYGVRIYAYAGKPYIKIDYQLQNSAKNKATAWPLYFESMNVDFRLNMGGSPTVRVGTQNSQTYQRSRDNGLYLAQESGVKYNVYDLQSKTSLSNGTKCPGYLDVSDGSTGVAAMTRYMQQLWPNGLSIDPSNKLQIQLFPEWSCEWTEPAYPDYPIRFSSTGLYWLENMQFVYKEMLLVFHNGSMSSDELDRLAKALEYPPVAAIPTGWYAQTRKTLDMGSIIPYNQKISSDDAVRIPEISISPDGTGWDWFKAVDERKVASAGVGGWPKGAGAFVATENPKDYYDAEQYALGEINIKPISMVNYNYERDFDFLHLGINGFSYDGGRTGLPFSILSYRLGGNGLDTSHISPTEYNAVARDYAHMWYYHVADAYFITGNPWIKDWYSFMGELLKAQTCDTFSGTDDFTGMERYNGHAVSNALSAYRITGDTAGYNMAQYFLVKRMAKFMYPTSGYIGSSPWQAGFGLRAMVDYMESVKENPLRWQQFVEAFSKVSGMMEHNYNYGNFAFAGASPFAASSSDIEASNWLDPVAWYYWNTGKKKYLDHAIMYINSGINGGIPAMYGNGEWTGEWAGRNMQYVREHVKEDIVPPTAITDLALARNNGTVTLNWTAPADARRYIVVWGNRYIAEESTIDTNQLNWWAANVMGPSFFATPGLKQSISFTGTSSGLICAAILSFDTAYNLSPMSNRAMTDNTPPNQPGNLQAVYIDAGHQASLSWSLSTDPESGVKYYNVYRNGTRIASAIALSFTDTDLKEATAYTYEVAAVNGLLVESSKNSFLLTTPVDVIPPSIVKIQAVNSANEVKVFFSEQVDSASAVNKFNYKLSSGNVLSVALQPDGKSVVLTCDNLVFGSQYVLTTNNVKDRANNANAIANGQVSFIYKEPWAKSNQWCNTETNHDMDWNVVEKDKEVYIDWPMSISIFPDEYLHAPLLRLLNNKIFTDLTADEPAFGFTTNKEVMVIVAFDDAERTAGHAPSWLTTGFVDKGKDIITYDKSLTYTGNPCYSLYEKKFPAGKVEINGKGGSDGYGYFLIVIPTDSSFIYVPPSRTEEQQKNEFKEGMCASPNPFNPQVRITVKFRSAANAILENKAVIAQIYNMQGRLVSQLSPVYKENRAGKCRYEYSWDGAGYASGAYLVSAKTQGKTWKKAIILLK